MKRIKQIRHMVIWHQPDGLVGREYSVWSLDNQICWEDFSSLEAAEKWCNEVWEVLKWPRAMGV